MGGTGVVIVKVADKVGSKILKGAVVYSENRESKIDHW